MGKLSSSEALCADCPNRSPLSALLAHLGMAKVGVTCPGTNIVDTIKVEQNTDNSNFIVTETEHISRQEQCGRDSISLPSRTVATVTTRNDQGRDWTRCYVGELAAAKGIIGLAELQLAMNETGLAEDRMQQRRVEYIEKEDN